MGDLRPRGGDEIAEDAGSGVLLVRRQGVHRRVEVGADDPLGPPEALEGRKAEKGSGGGLSLFVPEPGHDELEVGRLDARFDWRRRRPRGPRRRA